MEVTMPAFGLHKVTQKVSRARAAKLASKKHATRKRYREFGIFLVLVGLFTVAKFYFHKDFPVLYFDLAEHAALVVEVFAMATGEDVGVDV
jgi:hypothetical protein